MAQYRVKPDVFFDARKVDEGDGEATWLVATNDGTGEMAVTPEQFEAFFEEIPGDHAAAQHEVGNYVTAIEGIDGQWYWHQKASNGAVIATGGEGFTTRQHAERAAVAANPGIKLRTTLDEA